MPRTAEPSRKITAASIGGAIIAAFAASLCCLGPLVFAALGLGGAGLIARFEVYRPYLAVLTLLLLGIGFHFTYRKPAQAVEGAACNCELPRANRLGRLALWVAAVVVVGFLAFPYLAPVLFD